MEPDLTALGVRVVALSKDTVAEAAVHKARDGLRLTLLADPELAVIQQFGVEHHKAIGFTTGTFRIAGIPLGLRPSWKTMAIPTTLLVDEDGVVRWIDQGDDYRLRSDEAHVLEAVRGALGSPAATPPGKAAD